MSLKHDTHIVNPINTDLSSHKASHIVIKTDVAVTLEVVLPETHSISMQLDAVSIPLDYYYVCKCMGRAVTN